MSILNLYPGSGGGVASAGGGIPSGFIGIWSGSAENIPDGWALCDGENGTPDLRDKFVLGAGTTYNVSDEGGAATVKLTTNEMPKHRHSVYISNATGTSGTGNATDPLCVTNSSGSVISTYGIGSASSQSSFKWDLLYNATAQVGSSNAHENMPPYYTLCYIMKL